MNAQKALPILLLVLLLVSGIVTWWLLGSELLVSPLAAKDDLARELPNDEQSPIMKDGTPATETSQPEILDETAPADTAPTKLSRPEARPDAACSLTGWVVTTGGVGVPGLHVYAMGAGTRECATDAEGMYSFADLNTGTYRLLLDAGELVYVSGPGKVEVVTDTQVETPFVVCGRVNVRLRLLNERGEPLGATDSGGRAYHVTAVFTDDAGVTTRLSVGADTEGRVVFLDVPANATQVTVNVIGFRVPLPLPLVLTEGQMNNAGDVWLSEINPTPEFDRPPVGGVSGRVVNEEGDALPHIDVFAHRSEDKDGYGHTARVDLRTTTDAEGRFEFSTLAEGSWYFIVTNSDYVVIDHPGHVEVVADRTAALAKAIVLGTPTTLKLRLLDADGQPIAGNREPTQAVLSFSEPGGSAIDVTIRISGDGRVVLRQAPEGVRTLTISVEGYGASAEIRLNLQKRETYDAGDIPLAR